MEPVFFKIIYLKYKLAVFAGLPTFLPHQAKLGLTQTQRIRAPLSETEKVMVLFFSKTQKTFKKTGGKGSGQPPRTHTVCQCSRQRGRARRAAVGGPLITLRSRTPNGMPQQFKPCSHGQWRFFRSRSSSSARCHIAYVYACTRVYTRVCE